MSSDYFYITTPIYYVNDVAHIGHAYTSIAADMLARFMRLDGKTVRFVTGTDEHGQKIDKTASLKGMGTREFVDQVSGRFRDLAVKLNLSNDDFIRTTETRHVAAAQELWKRIAERGHIYEDKYSGWYCVRDEAFYSEKELVSGKSPTGADVEWVEESSYFFALSEFQEKLLDYYKKNPDFIGPDTRRNEVIRFVESGLHDLSISRTSFNWGIPVPGDERHIMYVWMDALTNYITALGFPGESSGEMSHFWPESVHIIGKDILRFHAVYWPAFLMAAGLTPPKRIFAHGWWTLEGEKMSKSLGNVVDPIQLVDEYGVDQVRYFLMREMAFGADGDFSRQAFIQRVNSNLSNDFGNLVQRVLSFIHKNAGACIPAFGSFSFEDQLMLDAARGLAGKMREEARHQAIHKMCEHLWKVIAEANRYVDSQAPWVLKKTDPDRMNTVLYVLVEIIRHLAVLASPIVPGAGARIMDQLNLAPDERDIASLSRTLEPGRPLPAPQGVFPRIQVSD